MSNTKEKINELKSIIEHIEPEEILDTIEEYIMEHEESTKFLAYFDTDVNQPSYTKYENVENYIELLDNYDDKIYLAQKMCDFDLAKKLFDEYPFSSEERKKFEELALNNDDLVKTLRPRILKEQYSFLNSKLDYISAEHQSAIQDRILRLDEKSLEIFKLLYQKIEKDSHDSLFKIFALSVRIGENSEITKNLYEYIKENGIQEDMSDKLLWLYTEGNYYSFIKDRIYDRIKTAEDINDLEQIIKQCCDETINTQKNAEEKDSSKIKDALLLSTYGISLDEAETILECYDISGIEVTEENKKQFLMYLALTEINNERNPEKLIEIYDEYTKENEINIDYLRTAVFEGELKSIFAKEFNKSFTPVNDMTLIEKNDGISIYDAGTNFKLCMTAIGAYQSNFIDKENYSSYWNSSKIMAHTSSCSLIANNNLTTANIKNICLGFSNFSDNAFYGGTYMDMASDSQYHVFAPDLTSHLSNPTNFINNTRGQYNELLYERRNIERDEHYKKNPDYILFFEEFDNIENEDNLETQQVLMDEKRKWNETLKAAKDFGVPVVKINRERCAKSEREKIEQNFQEYMKTYDPTLLSGIITEFENNRTGTRGHEVLTERYFSADRIQEILYTIVNSLDEIGDENLKKDNYIQLEKILSKEKKQTKECLKFEMKSASSYEQDIANEVNNLLGFDVDKYLEAISKSIEIEKDENER